MKADNFTTTSDIAKLIKDTLPEDQLEDALVIPIITKDTQSLPAIMSQVLPEAKLAPIITSDKVDEIIETPDVSDLPTADNLTENVPEETDSGLIQFYEKIILDTKKYRLRESDRDISRDKLNSNKSFSCFRVM